MTCAAVCKRLGIEAPCCGTCHLDAETGVAPLHVTAIGLEKFSVCCAVVQVRFYTDDEDE